MPRPDPGYTARMIGQLRSVVIDTRDPRALAAFYAELLGGKVTDNDEDWAVVVDDEGRRFAFQLSPEHEPPTFPDPKGSQQFHLDLRISRDELDEATRRITELGGRRLDAGEDDFQVFTDPAGHTFCLTWD
jgi:catechol 2,3-dioxygenase-like lactoylglutathione lyase family enzyme